MGDSMDITTGEDCNPAYQTASEIRIRRDVVPDESLTIGNILSRELLKLSKTDRAAIQEEIHGVRCLAIPETPELIRNGLNAFQTELKKVPSEQKQTYEECCVRSTLFQDLGGTCYALKESFKLSFLRVELFDAAKAVRRFLNYLEFVREFWGPEIALKRQVLFSDFTKAEMKLFRKGFFQVLPVRDRAGRRVLSLLGGFEPGIDPVMRAKALFYLLDVLTRDNVETQRTGIVIVTEPYMWSTGDEKRSTSSLKFPHPQEGLYYTKRVLESMPDRLIAIHNCWPDKPAFRFISKLLTIYGVSGATQRLRLKFHIGAELELRYRLKSYGIPIELLPITETGSIKMGNHSNWIKTRKHIEQAIDNSVTVVECPGLHDVGFRRGTSSMEHPGNVWCRDLILFLLDDRDLQIKRNPNIEFSSDNTTSGNNNSIASKIHNEAVERCVNKVEQRGGRFLEWNKERSAWIQILGGTKIRQKISVLFHSIDRRYRKAATSNSRNIGIRRIRSDSSMMIANNDDSNRRSYEEMVDAMETKSEENDTKMDDLGPYRFLEGGSSVLDRQPQCCQTDNNDNMNRKRLRKI